MRLGALRSVLQTLFTRPLSSKGCSQLGKWPIPWDQSVPRRSIASSSHAYGIGSGKTLDGQRCRLSSRPLHEQRIALQPDQLSYCYVYGLPIMKFGPK